MGFGNAGIVTALGQSDGIFATAISAHTKSFTENKGGWRVSKNPRLLGDVNGDGRADIVGIGNDAIATALGRSDATFAPAITAYTRSFTENKGGWRVNKNPRILADVNGDGRADLVGFGNAGIVTALGQSDGTFATAISAYTKSFTENKGGWRVSKNPRLLGDVNGDGRADIVGIGNDAIATALGRSDGTFASAITASNSFRIRGWNKAQFAASLKDIPSSRPAKPQSLSSDIAP